MGRLIVLDSDMGIIPFDMIREWFPDVTVELSEAVTPSQYEEADTVFLTANRFWTDEDFEYVDAGDWVTTIGAGYDEFPIAAFEERGIVFTNSRGLNAAQVAEHAIAMALAVTRNLRTYHEQQRERSWEIVTEGMTDLASETCAIFGLGHIGEEVAVRAKGFGMDVRGVKRDVDRYDGVADEVYGPEELDAALDDASLFVISAPHTPETEGIIGETALEWVAEDAIVVNVGRGPVVDTDGLLAALEADAIGTACLDVTDPEPLPEDHPLWAREDVFITPHCAGATDGYPALFLDFFEAQFERWVNDEPLENRVV